MRRGFAARRRLEDLEGQPLTYPEVGATADDALPAGYRHARWHAVVGGGRGRFDQAAEALMTWQVHRGAGLGLRASAPTAETGTVVLLEAGPAPLAIPAPCRVVYQVDEPTRRGFAYGSLPGHPEVGEECFVVEIGDDEQVTFTVTSFSRPSTWFFRLADPVARRVQDAINRRYLKVLTT